MGMFTTSLVFSSMYEQCKQIQLLIFFVVPDLFSVKYLLFKIILEGNP